MGVDVGKAFPLFKTMVPLFQTLDKISQYYASLGEVAQHFSLYNFGKILALRILKSLSIIFGGGSSSPSNIGYTTYACILVDIKIYKALHGDMVLMVKDLD